MMRQGTFIADFFPDDIKAQIAKNDLSNVNFFHAAPRPTARTTGMLGGGDLVGGLHTNNENKKVVVEYLTGKDFGTNGYASQAIFLSPHNDFDSSLYTTEFQTERAEGCSQTRSSSASTLPTRCPVKSAQVRSGRASPSGSPVRRPWNRRLQGDRRLVAASKLTT